MAGRKREFYNIVKANSFGALLFIVAIYAIDRRDFSLSMILLFYIMNIVLATIVRNMIHTFLRIMRKRGYNVKYILLVGYSRAAEEYINLDIAGADEAPAVPSNSCFLTGGP